MYTILCFIIFEQHCKETGDWAKLGILYIHVRRGCENFDDFEKYLLFIATILTSAVKEDGRGVPFCEFADAGKGCVKVKICSLSTQLL